MTKEYDNYEEMSSETEQEEYDEEYDENLPQYDENGNRYQDPEDQLPANPYERSSVYEGYSDLNKSQKKPDISLNQMTYQIISKNYYGEYHPDIWSL